MAFTMPAAVVMALSRAMDLRISEELTLRLRWPSARDVVWATSRTDESGVGKLSTNNIYAMALISSALIGMNGKPLTDFIEDDLELKELLERSPEKLSDAEHAHLCQAKQANLISLIPGDLLFAEYTQQFQPWLNSNSSRGISKGEENQLSYIVGKIRAAEQAEE